MSIMKLPFMPSKLLAIFLPIFVTLYALFPLSVNGDTPTSYADELLDFGSANSTFEAALFNATTHSQGKFGQDNPEWTEALRKGLGVYCLLTRAPNPPASPWSNIRYRDLSQQFWGAVELNQDIPTDLVGSFRDKQLPTDGINNQYVRVKQDLKFTRQDGRQGVSGNCPYNITKLH